jgi:hypothetical protein
MLVKSKKNSIASLDIEHVTFEDLMKVIEGMENINEDEKNIYTVVNIIVKRANEINDEINKKRQSWINEIGLNNIKEIRNICNYFEEKPKPHIQAISEFLNGELKLNEI